MDIDSIVKEIGRELDNKKATDILIYKIGDKASFADYMIIATAGSSRQLNALEETIKELCFRWQLEAKNIETGTSQIWTLMDYGDFLVNIFTEEGRERYALHKLWSDCVQIEF